MNFTKKIIVIGSIFLFFGSSILGIFSINGSTLNSEFWNIKQIHQVFAEDDGDDEHEYNKKSNSNKEYDEDDRKSTNPKINKTPINNIKSTVNPSTSSSTSNNSQSTCTTVYETVTNASGTATQVPRQVCTTSNSVSQVIPSTSNQTSPTLSTGILNELQPILNSASSQKYTDGIYIGNGSYKYTGGSITYSVSLTLISDKITTASFLSFKDSGNGKLTRVQGDAMLNKLVSSSKTIVDTVTGATGTSIAIQDAINDALSKALNTNKTSSEPISSATPVNNMANTKNTSTSSAKLTNYTAPNGKAYKIHQLSNSKFIFENPLGVISTNQFLTFSSIKNYIDKNNLNIQNVNSYIAPNGKIYMVVKDLISGLYGFKRNDGSLSEINFNSPSDVTYYIQVNNAKKIIVKKTIKSRAPTTPIVRTGLTPTPRAVSNMVKPTPVISSPIISKPISSPIVNKPVPVAPTTKVGAPVVDTTTKAS